MKILLSVIALYAALSAHASTREVVFIDTSVEDWEVLADGVKPGIEVVLLEASADGLAQMAAWAKGRSGYDAVHVISHGDVGQVHLGRDTIDAADLGDAAIAAHLAQLGQAFAEQGNLLVYGCKVASGEEGRRFVAHLAAVTGADVAASDDWTGAGALGGNWVLEYQAGAVKSEIVLNTAVQREFDQVLALPALETDFGTVFGGTVALFDATATEFSGASNNFTFTGTSTGGGLMIVNINSTDIAGTGDAAFIFINTTATPTTLQTLSFSIADAGNAMDLNSFSLMVSNASSLDEVDIRIKGRLGSADVAGATLTQEDVSVNSGTSGTAFTVDVTGNDNFNSVDEVLIEVFEVNTTTLKPVGLIAVDDISLTYVGPLPSNNAPTVTTTSPATDITGTSATLAGVVTADGGAAITARGVVYGTSADPAIEGNGVTNLPHASAATGTFTVNATGLTASTTYHFRAYATNSEGTSYGDNVTFTTSAAGVALSTNPTITFTINGTTGADDIATDGELGSTAIDSFELQIFAENSAGTKLTNNLQVLEYNALQQLTYETGLSPSFHAMVIQSSDQSNFSLQSFDFHDWGLYDGANYVVAAFDNGNPVGTQGTFSGNTTGVFITVNQGDELGTTFQNVDRVVIRQATGSDNSFIGLNNIQVGSPVSATAPTVTTTSPATDITATTATLAGDVTADGGATITARGVVYGTSVDPAIEGNGVTNLPHASGGTGTFTVNATGLTASTTYHFRAYATNSEGTSYGDDVTFTTDVPDTTPPTVTIGEPNFSTVAVSVPVTFTITYEGADTVTLADANVTVSTTGTVDANAVVSGSGTSTRTVTVTPTSGVGSFTISLAPNTASDAASNQAPAAGPSASVSVSDGIQDLAGNFLTDGTPTGDVQIYTIVFNQTPAIGGITTSTTIDDKTTATPFASVTIDDAEDDTVALTVTLDDPAKGIFTSDSLAISQFTDAGNGTYTLTSRAESQAQGALRLLVFDPAENRVAVGETEATTFTITANDGISSGTDNTTTVTATSVNDAPIAVTLTPGASEFWIFDPVNTVSLGTLSAADPDPDSTHTFTIVSVNGETSGTIYEAFAIANGDTLRVATPSALTAGTSYSFVIRADDGSTVQNTFDETFNNVATARDVLVVTVATDEDANTGHTVAQSIADGEPAGLSLREALHYAVDGTTILFDAALDTQTITLSTALSAPSGVTLDTDNVASLTIAGWTLTLEGGLNIIQGTGETLTITAGLAGAESAALTKSGAGTLTLGGMNIADGSGLAASITVTAGALSVAADSNLGTGAVTLDGGTLRVTANTAGFPIDNNIVLGAGGGTLEATNDTFQHIGVISGSGSLTKTGSGTLMLTGASGNTYTGDTNVNEGEVSIGLVTPVPNPFGPGNGVVTLSEGTTLNFNTSTTIPNPVIMSGTGSGGFGVILAGFANAGVTFSGAVTLVGDTLVDPGSQSLIFSGGVSDGGNGYTLTNAWSGTVVLSGPASNWTGGIATTASHTGRFSITDASNLGSGTIALNNGTLEVTGMDVTLNNAVSLGGNGGTIDNANALTLSGIVSGSGQLTKTGGGTLTLSGNNTYTSATTLSEGVLIVTHSNSLGTTTGGTTVTESAILQIEGGITLAEPISIDKTAALVSNSGENSITSDINLIASSGNPEIKAADDSTLTLSGVISGTQTRNVLFGASTHKGTVVLSGDNTFTNYINVNGGTLILEHDNALGAATNGVSTIASGAVLVLQGGITVAEAEIRINSNGVDGTGGLLSRSGNNTFSGQLRLTADSTIGVTEDSLILSGVVTDSTNTRNLTKVGAGTLVMTNTGNNYDGSTTVSAGILNVTGSLVSPVTVADGSTLLGTGSVGGVTVENGGTLSPGVEGAGVLTLNGNLTMSTGSTLSVEIDGVDAGTGYDQVVVNGSVDVSGATITVTSYGVTGSTNNTFVVIDNDSEDPVSGTFANAPQGGVFTGPGGNLLLANYAGGTDGNDVTLNDNAPPTLDLNGDGTGSGNTVTLTAAANGLADVNAATAIDVNDNWSEGTLTVQRVTADGAADGSANDVFNFLSGVTASNAMTEGSDSTGTLTVSNTEIGSYAYTSQGTSAADRGRLVVTFNADATSALVQTLVRNLGYTNTTPYGDAIFRFTLADGTGASTSADVTVTSSTIYVDQSNDTDSDGDAADGFTLREALALGVTQTGPETIAFKLPENTTINLLSGVTTGDGDTLDFSEANQLSLNGSTITLGGALTITHGEGLAVIASQLVGTNMALTKSGEGTITLSGSNTLTGTTTVSGGTLRASAGSALPDSGAVTVSNGGTLQLFASETIGSLTGTGSVSLGSNTLTTGGDETSTTFSGGIGGTGGLTKQGAGTFTLSGTNTFTGSTTVSAGTLALSGGAALADGSAVSVGDGATLRLVSGTETIGAISGTGTLDLGANALTISQTTDTTFNGGLIGTADGSLTKFGEGTLTLGGTNNADGSGLAASITVTAGALSVAADSNLGTGAVTLDGGTLRVTANIFGNPIDNNIVLGAGGGTLEATNGTFQHSGVISGSGSLTKSGSGFLMLTVASGNTYTGDTNVNEGEVSIGLESTVPTPFGTGNGVVTLADGTTLNFNTSATIPNPVIMSGTGRGGFGVILAGFANADITFSGAVTLVGDTLVDPGSQSLIFSGGVSDGGNGYTLTNAWSGTVVLSGPASNWTGGIATTASHTGSFSITDASNLGSGTIALNNGTLEVTGMDVTLNNAVSLGGNGGTIDNANALTLSGIVSGTGLTKIGGGALTLPGNNTYTGATTIDEGTLIVTHANGLGTTAGGTAVTESTVLQIEGGITLAEPISLDKTAALVGASGENHLTSNINILAATGNPEILAAEGATLTLSGVISGNQTRSILFGASTHKGTVVLSGDNTFANSITVNDGTLILEHDNALGATDNGVLAIVSGAVMVLQGGITVAEAEIRILSNGVDGNGGLQSRNGDNIFSGRLLLAADTTIGVTGDSLTLSGVVTDSTSTRNLTKVGAGTVVMTNTGNNYDGSTTVSAGVLNVTGSLNGTGAVSINSGSTLGGTGSISGVVTVNSGGTLAPGLTEPGVLTLNNNLTMSAGSTLSVQLDGAGAGIGYDQVVVNGTVDVSGATLLATQTGSPSGSNVLTLIGNDGTDGITGTFTGLAENATFTPDGGSTFAISYGGGEGDNDLVLTTNRPPEAPVLLSPVAYTGLEEHGRTLLPRPKLFWSVPSDPEDNDLQFKVYLDTVDGTVLIATSGEEDDYSGFEVSTDNGESWAPMTAAVEAPYDNKQVRFTPASDLEAGTFFWNVVANDGIVDGAAPTVSTFRRDDANWSPVRGLTGRISKAFVDQLRQEINYLLLFRGLSATTWSEEITSGVTRVRDDHVLELREALQTALEASGEVVPNAPALTPRQTRVNISHFSELSDALGSSIDR